MPLVFDQITLSERILALPDRLSGNFEIDLEVI